jgi:hypothetical protein
LRFLYGFLNHREGGMVSIRFSSFFSFTVYSITKEVLRSRKRRRMREFEEIEILNKVVEVTLN